MKNFDIKTLKMSTIIVVVVMAAFFAIYSLGVGVGMARQKKDMEDQIFKCCAITEKDECNMTIGDVRYLIKIEH